ncbi:PKD domain-containing protein [Halobellus sp. Atlit-31R]|nr:PKD domain-containing protein [Halobellus sp. Atlit-31R]
MTTTQSRFGQALAALVALTVALSAFGYAPVGTVAAQSVSVSNSPSATTAAPGDTVTITTTFTSTDVNGPGVGAQLPAGWIGETTDADGGFDEAEAGGNVLQVVWLENGTYEVTYDVEVPSDAAEGDYTVTTEGSGINPANGDRLVESTTTTITVETTPDNQPPSASFDVSPTEPTVGESVTVNASGSADADGSVESYAWDFGDGTTATGETATHTFTSPGEYEVELTVTDDGGANDTATQTVSVEEAAAPAAFQLSGLDVQSPVTQGDTATVSAIVENTGDDAGTQTVSAAVDGSTVDSQEVSLAGGASQSVSFDLATADLSIGDHGVEISTADDSATGQLTVTEPASEPPTDAPETSVSLSPTTSETFVGGTATYELVVDDASGGVGAYSATVSVDDPAVGAITGVELQGNPAGQTTDVDVAADGSSVAIDAALMDTADAGSVAVATITVQGAAAGSTDLSASLSALGNEAGTSYTVTDTQGASLSVTEKSTSVSLQPDSSEVAIDGTTTYELVVDNAAGGVGAYTATVSVDDPAIGSITDVELQGDPAEATAEADIAGDGSSVAIDAALMNTDDAGSVVVATITVEGAAAGSTALSTDVAALADENANTYAVTDATGASLTVTEITVGDYASPVTDVDDDGAYEDINGDGEFDIVDVQGLFVNLDDDAVQETPAYFDFNDDGTVDVVDVQALFAELTD